jgi:hypothetical protein
MGDESLYPPKCCVTLPWDEAKKQLPRQLAHQFGQKCEEFEVLQDQRVCCARRICSHFLGGKQALKDVVRCTDCGFKTCTHCKAASHSGECSTEGDVATQQTLKLAKEEGWQSCQECKRVVELSGGCNHITCLCGHEFCYMCGEKWRTCECIRHSLRAGFDSEGADDFGGAHGQAEDMEDFLVRQLNGMQLNDMW